MKNDKMIIIIVWLDDSDSYSMILVTLWLKIYVYTRHGYVYTCK